MCVCDIAIAIAMKNNCSSKNQLSMLKLELVTFVRFSKKRKKRSMNILYVPTCG